MISSLFIVIILAFLSKIELSGISLFNSTITSNSSARNSSSASSLSNSLANSGFSFAISSAKSSFFFSSSVWSLSFSFIFLSNSSESFKLYEKKEEPNDQ